MTPESRELLARLGGKYVWWEPVGGGEHPPARLVAQVMNLGTYDDIRGLERCFRPEALGEVLSNAAPGWFSPRAWEFWRGRLSLHGIELADRPPRRCFDAPDH